MQQNNTFVNRLKSHYKYTHSRRRKYKSVFIPLSDYEIPRISCNMGFKFESGNKIKKTFRTDLARRFVSLEVRPGGESIPDDGTSTKSEGVCFNWPLCRVVNGNNGMRVGSSSDCILQASTTACTFSLRWRIITYLLPTQCNIWKEDFIVFRSSKDTILLSQQHTVVT